MPIGSVDGTKPYEIPPPLPFSTEQNQPAPEAPPGSIGHQPGAIASQLVKGNPGGVGAGFGLGVALDASS